MDEELRDLILSMDKRECDEIRDVLKLRYNQLQHSQSLRFSPGMKVRWLSKRGGKGYVTGVVIKPNSKSISIKEDNTYTTWRVSPSLLEIM